MKIITMLLYFLSMIHLFSGSINIGKQNLTESSKEELSSIPLKNRPGVQRKTPWEKKQFPVKNADGSSYIAEGYRATFTGFDKTKWQNSSVNIILLFSEKNAGEIWLGSELGENPMFFVDTGNEIVACTANFPSVFLATTLNSQTFYSKGFGKTEANMDALVGEFYPDFNVRANYRSAFLDFLIPIVGDAEGDPLILIPGYSGRKDLIEISAKKDRVSFLFEDSGESKLRTRFWLQLPTAKILGAEILNVTNGRIANRDLLDGKIQVVMKKPHAQRITPWAKRQFPVMDRHGKNYFIEGYQATFNGIPWGKSISYPIKVILLFENERPGKIWMGTGTGDIPAYFIDSGEAIVRCFWVGSVIGSIKLESSFAVNEIDKKHIKPIDENMDKLVNLYYQEIIPWMSVEPIEIDNYFPTTSTSDSFRSQIGAGASDKIELKEIKVKDGNFGFLLQNKTRPLPRGWLWVKFPEARVVKAELIDDGTSSRTQDKASTETPPP
jgi:hypothetical protein